MAAPRPCDWHALRRLAKYLEIKWCDLLLLELVWMPGHSEEHWMCSGVLGQSEFLLHAHSRTQTALSSGEAEWYGCCRGAAALLYAQQLLKDVGITVDTPQLFTDATVAKFLAARQGLSRIRHLEVPLVARP
eukprot:302784-Amphidinium_carterae.2